jgi:hypothetical protein
MSTRKFRNTVIPDPSYEKIRIAIETVEEARRENPSSVKKVLGR